MIFNGFYKEVNQRKFNTWCVYIKRLDTYGCGCQHDCKYCYAKSLLYFRGLWNSENPKVSNICDIKKRIEILPLGSIVRLGGMTDCFQPIEKEHRVTLKTIRLLNKYRINYLIMTKSDLVASDEYLEIYNKDLAHFHISISGTNDKKCLEYEKATVVSKRIKAIEKLFKLGFDVSVRLSPFIEANINFDILNNILCDKILIEFLKTNHWIKKEFDIDYSDYTYKYGGYDNLELDKKIELVNKITGFYEVSIGEYVKEHHDYFRKNVNYNKNDCCNLDLKPIEILQQLNIFS